MNCCNCWPTPPPERSSQWRCDEVRSALEKTESTGLQIDVFRRFYELDFCIFSYLEKHWSPSWWQLSIVTDRNPQKICTLLMYFCFSKSTYILTSFLPLAQFLRAIWNAVSWPIVSILPQIKQLATLSCFFFSLSRQHSVFWDLPQPFRVIFFFHFYLSYR